MPSKQFCFGFERDEAKILRHTNEISLSRNFCKVAAKNKIQRVEGYLAIQDK